MKGLGGRYCRNDDRRQRVPVIPLSMKRKTGSRKLFWERGERTAVYICTYVFMYVTGSKQSLDEGNWEDLG